MSTYLPDAATFRTYSDFIFYEGGDEVAETRRYMTKMVALSNEAADFYLRNQRSVMSTEIEAWRRLVAAVVQSESLWTHYRLAADHRLKIARSDAGHGYGLTAIDDRSHPSNVVANTDLVHNLRYAMDILFADWERAGSAACVSSPFNWRDRSRAAFSGFNGGFGQLCRWAHTSSYSHIDQTFAANYDGQAWLTYVDDPHAKSGLNLSCLFQKSAEECLK